MSKAAPYLPGNRPEAPHHLVSDSIDRLLDTHFRLLRHDIMHPLLLNVQGVLAQAGALSGSRFNEWMCLHWDGHCGTTYILYMFTSRKIMTHHPTPNGAPPQ